MSVDARIKSAVDSFGFPVENSVYHGQAEEYLVFNYFTLPRTFGDDEPEHEEYFIQLHYFAPLRKNILEMKRQIKRAIVEAEFSYPSTVDASDNEARHIVFEFKTIEGAD